MQVLLLLDNARDRDEETWLVMLIGKIVNRAGVDFILIENFSFP